MDSFEWNKIAGAVLGTALFVMVVRIASEAIFTVPPPAKPGYVVEGVVESASAATGPAAAAEEPLPDFATVIPAANVASGQQIAVRCAQCHDWSKGGPNKIGPNLYGIIGRPRASHPGFSYSSAMQKKGGSWSYEDIFRYLRQPAKFVPGNKMAFAGLPKPQDRINLMAYMRTWADSPPALPPHQAAPAAPKPAPTPARPAKPTPAAPPHH
jgi:cytochrome c